MKKIALNFLMFFSLLSFTTKGQVASKPCQTAELVVNGNFALTTGFASQLALNPACTLATYNVNTNLNTKCVGWPNVPDHTPGGGTKMLICDGFETGLGSKIMWSQQVSVCANKTYTFSFWSNSAYVPSFNLNMVITSGVYGTTSSVTSNLIYSTWVYHQMVWTAPSTPASGNVFLQIGQNSFAQQRDFGIDDISFRYCCPPISASVSQTICAGTTVTLQASGATSYTWYPGAITGSSIVVTPGSTTTYTVNGMGGCACSPSLVSTTTTVTVLPAPTYNPDFYLGGMQVNANDYTITANPLSTPASFWWEVSEVDVTTGTTIIPNTTMTNAQTWWYSPFIATNTFPGYNAHLVNCEAWPPTSPIPTPPYSTTVPGAGIFLIGHKYRVTRATWGPCTPWSSVSKTIITCNGPCRTGNGGNVIIENIDYHPAMPEYLMLTNTTENKNEIMNDDIIIAPNPTNGIFSVNMQTEALRDIYVYDVTGKIVFESKGALEKSVNVDLNSQAEGIYFIRIMDAKTSVIKKVIKQ